ncbi:hypothetical protein DN069_07955 [Streptacidiphilus pinicola]|uniref:Uncharacterized protein n=1 Tax=Streptacidiphilus pinicola TaxID=2219663 RepID=A0A2X0KAG8_9ACTN|nr:DUF5994 family protein [Streptacidiphilus pinicola]RAG86195.1 hypothetical protein DN069_07955 [Streptacidiphilus pinicola]
MSVDPSTTPSAGRLLDGNDWPRAPGAVVPRLETTASRLRAHDGAWWPRPRDLAAELPALITAVTESVGPIERVGLDAAAWDEVPGRMTVDDRVVHIDRFPVGDDTVILTCGDHDHFVLLVVPPGTDPAAAQAAVAAAVLAGASDSARQIFVKTGIAPAV